MVTLKAGLLLDLPRALAEWQGEKLPFKVAYWVNRLASKIRPEFESFNKTRMELVAKFCDKDEHGKPVVDDNGRYVFSDQAAFNKEYQELAGQEIEVNINPIVIDLDSMANVQLPPFSIEILCPFLEVSEDENHGHFLR